MAGGLVDVVPGKTRLNLLVRPLLCASDLIDRRISGN